MAGNTKNPNFEGKADSIQLESVFKQERDRKVVEICSAMEKSKEIWNLYSTKNTALERINQESETTGHIFAAIIAFLKEHDEAFTNNVRFVEILRETGHLLHIHGEFNWKMQRSNKAIKYLCDGMTEHMEKVDNERITLWPAKSAEEITEIHIPNLDWLESIPDPKIEKLVQDWDNAQLNARANNLMIELRTLL